MIRTDKSAEGSFESLSGRLLAWYDANRRDLPWRAAPGTRADPYRVWLSEVMLQQTRVETVRPYFERWVARFPSLEALAAAELDEVLKAWEGLGYYSRARNLHRAVREVVAEHDTVVPGEMDAFRRLPGVGRYTAGAVLSIAFGQREPVVDGNVRRVFARWMDDPEPTDQRLWSLAAELLPGDRPGDFNQALMELGATVCTPRAPRCMECPVRSDCRAQANGTQAERPSPKRKAPLRVERHGVAVVTAGDRLLLVRRPTAGRLGGLWEFPGVEAGADESSGAAAVRAARELGGVAGRVGNSLGRVRHAFTHVIVEYFAYRVETSLRTAPEGTEDRVWVARPDVAALSLPSAQHRILQLYDATLEDAAPPAAT